MRFKKFTSGILLAIFFTATTVLAVDYSKYSLDELYKIRPTVMEKSSEEQQAFWQAWRTKMQQATPQERMKYCPGCSKRWMSMNGNGKGYKGNCPCGCMNGKNKKFNQ